MEMAGCFFFFFFFEEEELQNVIYFILENECDSEDYFCKLTQFSIMMSNDE